MRIKRHYFDVAHAGGIMGGAVNQILILKSRPHKNGKVLVKKGVLDAALLGLAPFTGGVSAGLLTALRGGQALRSTKKLGGLKTAQTGAQAGLTTAEAAPIASARGMAIGEAEQKLIDAGGESGVELLQRNALRNQMMSGQGKIPDRLVEQANRANTTRMGAINTAQENVSNLENQVGVLEAQVPAQQKAARDAAIVTGTTGMGHGGANAAAQAEEALRLQERAAGAATGTTGTHMGSMNSSTG